MIKPPCGIGLNSQKKKKCIKLVVFYTLQYLKGKYNYCTQFVLKPVF